MTEDSERELRAALKRLKTEAEARETDLRRQAEAEARARKFWTTVLEQFNAGNVAHVCAAMDRHLEIMHSVRARGDNGIVHLERLWKESKLQAAELKRRYPGVLEKKSKERRLPLDPESRHPKYTFDGFIQLEIDDSRSLATVRTSEGRPTSLPFDVGPVLELVAREHKRLFGGRRQPKALLKKIRSAYLAVVRERQLADGDSAPVREVMNVLAKDKKFRADEFVVQLSALVKDEQTIDGKRLDLQQTKDPKGGVLLRGAAGRGFVGFVTFREVEK